MNVEHWLTAGGLAVLALVVFAESGLLLGFFLPGDTLLFVAGFLSSAAGGHHLPPLPVTALVAFAAATAGDQTGYVFGRRVGPALFNRPRSRLFNPANIERANEFFDHRGPAALVVARFVPVVRTFVPIVAGVASMHYRRFLVYNVIGAFAWAVGITTLGYFLGEIDLVKHNLDYAAVAIATISLLPVLREVRHARAGVPACLDRPASKSFADQRPGVGSNRGSPDQRVVAQHRGRCNGCGRQVPGRFPWVFQDCAQAELSIVVDADCAPRDRDATRTGHRMKLMSKFALGAVLTAATVTGGAIGSSLIGTAGAQTSTTTATADSSNTATTPDKAAIPEHGTAEHEALEQPVTGASATSAQDAAVASLGGGTAGAVTSDAHGDGYEVTVTKTDGTQVEVHLDSSFAVQSGHRGHHGGGNDNDADDAPSTTQGN